MPNATVIDIIGAARSPPNNKRVLIWSGTGIRGWRWKPAKWEAATHAGRAGMFLDCGTGPVEFTHWCLMPPKPEEE